MQKYEKMMSSQVRADVVVFVGCNCPILFLLRWVVEMPNLDPVVVVVDDNANHARYGLDVDAAIFLLVDELDVLALFLCDVLYEMKQVLL